MHHAAQAKNHEDTFSAFCNLLIYLADAIICHLLQKGKLKINETGQGQGWLI